MIPKHVINEIERLQRFIGIKKDRIEKLGRLSKLGKNLDLISEYDAIIKQAEETIMATAESKDILEAHKEQVVLHACAAVRLMAVKGLKASLTDSQNQIEHLNNAIEDDNRKINELKDRKNHGGRII